MPKDFSACSASSAFKRRIFSQALQANPDGPAEQITYAEQITFFGTETAEVAACAPKACEEVWGKAWRRRS